MTKEDNENWVDIIGYENHYQIRPDGKIRGLTRTIKEKVRDRTQTHYGEEIVPFITNVGYPAVNLSKDSEKKQKHIHRLLAIHFIPNPDNKPHINHKNGIKTDYRLENLEWCTRSENQQHRYKTLGHTGSMKGRYGKNHVAAKKIMGINGDRTILFDTVKEAMQFTKVKNQFTIRESVRLDRFTMNGWKFKYIPK